MAKNKAKAAGAEAKKRKQRAPSKFKALFDMLPVEPGRTAYIDIGPFFDAHAFPRRKLHSAISRFYKRKRLIYRKKLMSNPHLTGGFQLVVFVKAAIAC